VRLEGKRGPRVWGAQRGEAGAGWKHRTAETPAPHATVPPAPRGTLQPARTVSAAAGEIGAGSLGSLRSCFISSEQDSVISASAPSRRAAQAEALGIHSAVVQQNSLFALFQPSRSTVAAEESSARRLDVARRVEPLPGAGCGAQRPAKPTGGRVGRRGLRPRGHPPARGRRTALQRPESQPARP